jgi:chorismate dehydratase
MLRGEQRGKFDLDFTTPARCADAIRSGAADIGIIPSIEYQRIAGTSVLPGLSIAAKSAVRSVLLLSNRPIEDVRTVAMDNSSRTSVALLGVLLRRFYGVQFASIAAEPDAGAMLQRADAALLIGDPALTYGGPARVYDLAAEWKRFTGLPFVFALWVGRPGADVASLKGDFAASRDFGLKHIDDIAAEHATRLGMNPEAVKVYLTENINYTLDEENVRGLELFHLLARELGILESVRPVHFV